MKLVFVILVPIVGFGFTVDEPRNYLEKQLFPVVNRSFCRPQWQVLLARRRPFGGRMRRQLGNNIYLFVADIRGAGKRRRGARLALPAQCSQCAGFGAAVAGKSRPEGAALNGRGSALP